MLAQIGTGGALSSAYHFFEVDTFISQNYQEYPDQSTPLLALWTIWVVVAGSGGGCCAAKTKTFW